ncbi:UNVERIFIED_CONTAM: hypothetical protein GTU68_006937 [Idotea baltica]|nr:hypothetical protein [Idotea baltica]
MPLIGLGTWKSDDRAAYRAVKEAIRIGYRHFDCASRYGNEAEIGETFAEVIEAGEVKRDDLWITSKLWNNAHLPKDVEPALRETLKDLQVVESHPLLQQKEILSFCTEHQISVTAYSPLGSMDRPARLKKDDEPIILENPVILEIAQEIGCSAAQVLIAWAAQRGTAVIPKSSNPERLQQNLEAQNITLSASNMNKLSLLDQGVRFVDGSIWALEGSPYNVDDLWNH